MVPFSGTTCDNGENLDTLVSKPFLSTLNTLPSRGSLPPATFGLGEARKNSRYIWPNSSGRQNSCARIVIDIPSAVAVPPVNGTAISFCAKGRNSTGGSIGGGGQERPCVALERTLVTVNLYHVKMVSSSLFTTDETGMTVAHV